MLRHLLSICCCALLTATAGAAAADDALERARAALERNDARAAYEILAPLAEAREGEPEYDYLYGIAALDSGRTTEAVFALERVLAVQPDNDVARAEIARAYFLLGERETARQEFETVQESGAAPPSARQTIDRYLALLDRGAFETEQEGTAVTGYVDVSVGFDSNINSATDQSQVALPILGNVQFQLNEAAREIENSFGQIAGAVNVSHPVGDRFRAIGGARGFNRFTKNPFATRDLYAYAGMSMEEGKNRYSVAATAENFAVDGDTLRNVFGGYGQWTHALDDTSRVNLSVQGAVIEYINLPARDVNRFVGSVGYIKAFDHARQPLLFAGAYGGVEDEHNEAFPQFGHTLYGGRIGGSFQLKERTRAFGSVAVEQRDYNGPDTIFLTTRDDTQLIVSAGVEYEVIPDWRIVPEVSYINNDSNIPLNDYDRWVTGVRVRFTF